MRNDADDRLIATLRPTHTASITRVLLRWRSRPIALAVMVASTIALAACGPSFAPGYNPYNNYRSGYG